jgi:LEA14-like dessication related protein
MDYPDLFTAIQRQMSNTKLTKHTGFLFILLLFSSCVPKEQVILRNIKDVKVDAGIDGNAKLNAIAVFYNPNPLRMKLKEIDVQVFVDGKKSAQAKQKFNFQIPAQEEFSVPLEVQLALKEIGLLDTLLSLFGGKKYDIRYVGFVRVKVHGITIKVPIDYKDEIKLKF